jgi:neurofibromin 1
LTFQTTQNQDNAELFVNCLEAMVETCLPGDDLDVQNPYPSSLGIVSNLNLSSSMSSLSMGSLHSPTEKDTTDLTSVCSNGNRMRHGSATATHMPGKVHGSFKRKDSGKKKTPDTLE